MASSPAPMSSPPAMIGRARERVFLHEEVAHAIAGSGRLVLVGGEAGIGKTTLARDAINEARQLGALVLTGHCHDLTSSPPYAPWLDLAIGYPDDPALPALPDAFSGGNLSDIQSQSALFAETLAFLSELSRIRPVVVLLEDLHWSDSASLELLRFLAARISHLPVFLLITYRVDELTRRHPLYQQLPGLVRAGLGLRLDLRRLDDAGIGELIRTRHQLSATDEQRLCSYLEQHAQGNPFYATELIRALEETGDLKQSNGGSTLGALEHVVLPTLLAQVIDARVNRLGESTRRPLSMAAVIGEEVPLDLWGEVAELDDDQLLSIVEDATDAHLLEATRDGARVRFIHALTRDALYESIFPPRRRLWHKAIADSLIRRPHPDPDAVAHHLTQAGDPRAPEWLEKAGNRAQRAYTWLIAAERFVAAAAALESTPNSERQRGWLLFRAARLMRLARPERGLELLHESLRLAEIAGDNLLAGDTHYSIGLLMIYSGHISEGTIEMEAGIWQLEALSFEDLRGDATVAVALADVLPQYEAAADIEVESSVVLQRDFGINHRKGSLPWWYAAGGRHEAALEIGVEFIKAVERIPHPGGLVQSATAHAYHGLGFAYAAAGKPDDARASFESARAIYRSLDHHGVIALVYMSELRHIAKTYGVDDLPRRRFLSDEAVAAIGQAGGAMPPGFPANIARLPGLVIEGAWDEALAIIGELHERGNSFFRRSVEEAAAEIYARRGDFAAAWGQIASSVPQGPDQPFGSLLFQETLFYQRLAAGMAAIEGRLGVARSWLEAHDRWLSLSGALLGVADGKLAWADYFNAAGDHSLATKYAAEALAHASDPRQPLVMLRAHRLLGKLKSSHGEHASAAAHFDESLRLASMCQAPYEQAMTEMALAEHKIRERQTDEAEALLLKVEAVLRALRAAPALGRIEEIKSSKDEALSPSLPFGLTAREAEVLKLVARGLTDAAVADQLFISPRTVGQHLRSVYGKLDVSSRSAATRLAIEHKLA